MKKFVSLIAMLTLGLILMACATTKYTVTFESNQGSAVEAISVESGKTISAPTAPVRSGYAFEGWFKEAALTNPWVFATDTVTSDITLYAKWSMTDQAYVDQVYDWLSLGNLTGLTTASPRLIFPTNRDGVTISWSIDKPLFIQYNGVINQPTFEEGDQTVSLTATLSKGSATREKVFTATVLKLASIEDTPPLLNEDFKMYTAGNIIGQSGLWAPVSGKAGNSLFTVISSLTPAIPNGSNALKIEALTELQIEGSIAHSYDVLVFEVDLLQSSSSNASAINIQSSSSSPVVAFGLDGASLFYRTDNGTLMKTEININQWYTLRVEVDLVNKTIEAFYYEDGQLVSLTPGKVTYTGTTPFQSVFIRSGSSTTTTLREPAYITNFVVNRIEALPRPEEVIKLGEVTGIQASVSLEEGSTFTVAVPEVYNYFGAQQLLVKDTDYTLAIDNPVNTAVPGDYVVTYTFTNSANASDVKVVTQNVNIYSAAEPNEISSVVSTPAGYLEQQSDITITVVQPSGTLYYLLSNNETETKAAIMAGVSQTITAQSVVLDDLNVGTFLYIHVFVDLNGDSNMVSHLILREAVTEITSVSQFVTIFSTTAADITTSYALMTDIDLTGIVWADGNTSFKAKFYGNGHIISNLTMTKTGTNYGGLFARINGGMVRDLVLDNIHVTAADRAGILAGRVENGNSSITNIVIMNSSVTGASSNGVGGVIGLVSRETTMSNITLLDSEVNATGVKNVGGVVGRVDGAALIASDIYVRGVLVKTNVIDALDIAAGALVGYVRDSVASVVTANRIIIIDTAVDAQVAGALIGYNRAPGSATVQNAYVEVNFTHPTAVSAGLIGRVNNETDKLNTTTIFGVLTGSVENVQAQAFVNTTVPADLAWWTTNLPVFTNSDLWTLDANKIFALDNYIENSAPMLAVELVYNITLDNQQIQIRQGAAFMHMAPEVGGYQFVGWFLDIALSQALPEGYLVSEAVTLYGKYETVPASQVTFVTNVEGLTVPMQEVNYGQLATLPIVENQMMGVVLKEVVGWTINGQPFDFSTPILGNTELVAVWSTVELTVTFNGGNAVTVLYGELVSAPVENPTHYFSEVTFKEWQLSGVAFDFNTPITANINLVGAFNTPASISIDTVEEFHYMATVESTYTYVLSTNLDFATFTWTYVNTSFKGSFDGQGYTISNLSMTGLTGYAGVFPRANGATITNLVLDNITIATTARAGVLVGRIENNGSTIENVVVKNSSVSGADSNGVGGLVGQISKSSNIFNVAVINTNVTNNVVNVGGLVGRIDGGANVIADDIFISNVTVKSNSANTSDVAASALVGYIANVADSVFSGVRIVVLDTTVDGNVTAAFVGYNRYPGTANLMDAYFEVTFVNNERSGLIGYNRDQVTPLDQSSIFGSFTNDTPHSNALALTNSAVPADSAWWTTNLNNIATSSLWVINPDGSVVLALLVD
ncbi:InlB B-repeat-containing protein [Paracholeplasma manati]|uniref:InlB B-repeat-containing protein n=1 Tax=Paracholeplasma manati TaxID=591373 RepID=UPI0024087631|nr:InlB B-repeat-containing protein [Paracholeplasma manati]MDG0889623.1 InlB B-repeat-containing protein [Paracholeplasma manati]